ncbi:hypothetical protein L596_009846 [Steinernema carpocapsae]|uniref:Uncharacterized protein n=1 Tax=Steinernema carpocapsae TaxID=34508 RepID=A0A4U5PH20_STECR|nr:hypothetical protein L596_009846 [Steinernema carpocapsae]
MERICYEFANSVAHQLSTLSASHLSLLHKSLWGKIGSTHKDERNDYRLAIFSRPNGVLGYLSNQDVTRFLFPEKIPTVLGTANRYIRITEVFLENDNLLTDENDDTDLLKSLGPYLKQQPITYLSLNSSLNNVLKSEHLWKFPVIDLAIPNKFTTQEILDYHLLENENLEQVLIANATRGYMYWLTEIFRRGQGVEVLTQELRQHVDSCTSKAILIAKGDLSGYVMFAANCDISSCVENCWVHA